MVVKALSISSSELAPITRPLKAARFPWAFVLALVMVLAGEMAVRCVDPRKVIPYEMGLQEHFGMAAHMHVLGPAEVSILGSSRTRQGVQAGRMREICQEQFGATVRVANYACSAARANHYYTHVRAMLKQPVKPRLILIGLSPRDLRGDSHDWSMQAIWWDLGDWFREFREHGWVLTEELPTVVRNEIGWWWRTLYYRQRAGIFLKQTLCGMPIGRNPAEAAIVVTQAKDPDRSLVTHPVSRKTVVRYVKTEMSHKDVFVFDPLLQDYLERTLEMCRKAQVPVVVFEVPPSDLVKETLPAGTYPKFLALAKGLTARHGVPLVTVDELGVQFSDEDFREASHMNARGGRKLTEALAKRVVGPIVSGWRQGTPAAGEMTNATLIAKPVVRASEGGALSVGERNGKRTLCDAKGNPIQLRGMSTHGLQWFPEILNENAFAALSQDWGANVIRLAMYVTESGYATKPELFDSVVKGIRLAKEADMYVIVDWHILKPGSPSAPAYSGAMEFFRRISAMFPNDPAILYELCNEPNAGEPGVSNDEAGWKVVKAYAQPIIAMLRESGNRNIVLVGSPSWSQRPDLAAADPIDDANTMYSFHFYTGTHLPNEYVWKNVAAALEKGLPLFATEWGTTEASGDKGPFLDHADTWLDFLNRNNISWCNWSLGNASEVSCAFMPTRPGISKATPLDPGADRVWAPGELSPSGRYARARIKGIPFVPVSRKRQVEAEGPVHAERDWHVIPLLGDGVSVKPAN